MSAAVINCGALELAAMHSTIGSDDAAILLAVANIFAAIRIRSTGVNDA